MDYILPVTQFTRPAVSLASHPRDFRSHPANALTKRSLAGQ
jgi:hypothetical protein